MWMKETNHTEQAKAACLRLLAVRARSRRELKERLEKRGFSAAAIGRALAELRQLGLVNDGEFARAWVEERLRSRPLGEARLRWELRRRGVSEKMAAAVVRRALGDERELRTAGELAQARLRRVCPEREVCGSAVKSELARLSRFLAGRGFSYEVIREVINNLRSGGAK